MAEYYSSPFTLERWLKIATHELCDKAKTRVHAEIQEHYTDAVERLMSTGYDRLKAETAALQSLGDPYDAERKFRAIHLTTNEAGTLKSQIELLNTAIKWRRESAGFILMLVLSLFLLWAPNEFTPIQKIAHFIFIAGIAATSWAILYWKTKSRWPQLITLKDALTNLELFYYIITVMTCLILAYFDYEHAHYGNKRLSLLLLRFALYLTFFSVFSLFRVKTRVNIIRKLDRNAHIADELDPPAAAGA